MNIISRMHSFGWEPSSSDLGVGWGGVRGVRGGPSAVLAFRFTEVIIFIMGLENRGKNMTIIAAKLLSLPVHPTGRTPVR